MRNAMRNVACGFLMLCLAGFLAGCTKHGNTTPAVVPTPTPTPAYAFIINNKTGVPLDVTTTLARHVTSRAAATFTLAAGKDAVIALVPAAFGAQSLASVEMADAAKDRIAVNVLSTNAAFALQMNVKQLTQLSEIASTIVTGGNQTVIATMYPPTPSPHP